MGNIVHNVAKGRVAELVNRVNNNDPANSAIIAIPVKSSGNETDAVLRDKADVSAYFSGTTDEATGTNWNRKTLTDASGLTVTVDNSGDVVNVDCPDLSWNPGPSADNSARLLLAYDNDTTAGTDANLIPLVSLDFAVTVDGNILVFQFNATGFYQAA